MLPCMLSGKGIGASIFFLNYILQFLQSFFGWSYYSFLNCSILVFFVISSYFVFFLFSSFSVKFIKDSEQYNQARIACNQELHKDVWVDLSYIEKNSFTKDFTDGPIRPYASRLLGLSSAFIDRKKRIGKSTFNCILIIFRVAIVGCFWLLSTCDSFIWYSWQTALEFALSAF